MTRKPQPSEPFRVFALHPQAIGTRSKVLATEPDRTGAIVRASWIGGLTGILHPDGSITPCGPDTDRVDWPIRGELERGRDEDFVRVFAGEVKMG